MPARPHRVAMTSTAKRSKAAKKRSSKKKTTRKTTKKATTSAEAKPRRKRLQGVSDIRRFFHRNREPVFFISATNFNLLGMEEWVGNFWHINFIDCFDGQHPNVYVPREIEHEPWESIEDINCYLLEHKEVIDFIKSKGGKPKAVFLMFDERVEKICKELGIEVWFPKAALREAIDHKIETVRIGNKAGVPSVPNVLAEVKDYEDLKKTCETIKGHGFSTVQLDLHFKDIDVSEGQMTPDKCRTIRDTFRDHHLPVCCISAYTNIVHPDAGERKKRNARLKEKSSNGSTAMTGPRAGGGDGDAPA